MKKYFFAIALILPFVTIAQTITTFVGTGIIGSTGDNGPATAAKINSPQFGAFDKNGNYYFSQLGTCKIRKVDISGVITTVAGSVCGYGGDGGQATTAKLNYPAGIAFDTLGNLYIADNQNYRIRKVDISTGIISTFAGNGSLGYGGDGGLATAAMLTPVGICIDKNYNLYISDNTHNSVRKIDVSNIISTYAGTGTAGFSGDNGLATSANLYQPNGIAIDTAGNLFLADMGNYRIRKIGPSGIISTIAGTGIGLYSGDGMPATATQMKPGCITFDKNNNLYVSDSNQRVLLIDLLDIVHTFAGNGVGGYNGDGIPATSAQVNSPGGIVADACGSVYFTDDINNRIRKVTLPPILIIPTITLSGITSATVGALVTVTATVTNAGSSYIIYWMNHGIGFTTTTLPSVTYTKPAGTDTITARVVSTATYGCYDSTTSAGHVVAAENTGVPFDNPSAGLRMTVEVWPNPAGDMLHVIAAGSTQGQSYIILSIIGTVIQQGALKEGSNNIPIQSLPKGMYMLVITNSEGEKKVTKVIKQ